MSYSYRLPLPISEFPSATVSILAEVPEALHNSLIDYLDAHPDWDQDQAIATALSLFLAMQQPCGEGRC